MYIVNEKHKMIAMVTTSDHRAKAVENLSSKFPGIQETSNSTLAPTHPTPVKLSDDRKSPLVVSSEHIDKPKVFRKATFILAEHKLWSPSYGKLHPHHV